SRRRQSPAAGARPEKGGYFCASAARNAFSSGPIVTFLGTSFAGWAGGVLAAGVLPAVVLPVAVLPVFLPVVLAGSGAAGSSAAAAGGGGGSLCRPNQPVMEPLPPEAGSPASAETLIGSCGAAALSLAAKAVSPTPLLGCVAAPEAVAVAAAGALTAASLVAALPLAPVPRSSSTISVGGTRASGRLTSATRAVKAGC